jgi:hypothetical protein
VLRLQLLYLFPAFFPVHPCCPLQSGGSRSSRKSYGTGCKRASLTCYPPAGS